MLIHIVAAPRRRFRGGGRARGHLGGYFTHVFVLQKCRVSSGT